MPNKKKQRNPFYFFMKEMQANLAAKGQNYSMSKMPDIAHAKWTQLSLAEKQKYEEMAKIEKLEFRQDGRLTSDGLLVKELLEQQEEQEELERQLRQGITDFLGRQRLSQEEFIATNKGKKLYFIAFNVLCRVRETGAFIPLEIGLVEYTIKNGMQKEYHNLIHPGEIPKGYTGDAMRHSESTHHISIFGQEGSERNYCKIWDDIMDFINPLSESDLPPLFCANQDIAQNLGSLEWLAQQADEDSEGIKVWDANYLHMEMRAGAGCPTVSYFTATEELQNTAFDYTSGLKCHFHEEDDNLHCAIRKVKSLCCVISDVMCRLFKVNATDRHLPERISSERTYEVITPADPDTLEGYGRGKPRVSDYGSRPGSAVHGRVQRDFSRSDSEISRNERTGGSRSPISVVDAIASDNSNSSGESDNESETGSSVSSTENQNPQRIPQRATGASSVVQLRQPVSQSIALSLARARAAPAVVPGKGIGRGQRKV